jgi:hypothetical protein
LNHNNNPPVGDLLGDGPAQKYTTRVDLAKLPVYYVILQR